MGSSGHLILDARHLDLDDGVLVLAGSSALEGGVAAGAEPAGLWLALDLWQG